MSAKKTVLLTTTLVMLGIGASTNAAGVAAYSLNFRAPVVGNEGNVPLPNPGDIIYDYGSNSYKGYDKNNLWQPFGNGTSGNAGVTSGVDSTYSILTTDEIIIAEPTANRTFTLPTAIGATGKIYQIVKGDTSTYTISIATTSSQTISGRASAEITLYRPGDFLRVVSNGTNWTILSKKETQWLSAQTANRNNNASGASGEYHQLSGNSVTLTRGEWDVEGHINVYSGNGISLYVASSSGFFEANGADSSTAPTAISSTILDGNVHPMPNTISCGIASTTGVDYGCQATLRMRISVTAATQDVYLVPFFNYTSVGSGTNNVSIFAKRIW